MSIRVGPLLCPSRQETPYQARRLYQRHDHFSVHEMRQLDFLATALAHLAPKTRTESHILVHRGLRP